MHEKIFQSFEGSRRPVLSPCDRSNRRCGNFPRPTLLCQTCLTKNTLLSRNFPIRRPLKATPTLQSSRVKHPDRSIESPWFPGLVNRQHHLARVNGIKGIWYRCSSARISRAWCAVKPKTPPHTAPELPPPVTCQGPSRRVCVHPMTPPPDDGNPDNLPGIAQGFTQTCQGPATSNGRDQGPAPGKCSSICSAQSARPGQSRFRSLRNDSNRLPWRHTPRTSDSHWRASDTSPGHAGGGSLPCERKMGSSPPHRIA